MTHVVGAQRRRIRVVRRAGRPAVLGMLVLGMLGTSSCSQACTKLGGASHVNVWTPSLDLAQPVSGDGGTAPVVRVCKEGTQECGENQVGVIAGQTSRAPMTSVPLAIGGDETRLTVELRQGGTTTFGPGPITVHPKKWEPNGEGCDDPPLAEAAVVIDRGGVHEYDP